jgi:hypothetical protein
MKNKFKLVETEDYLLAVSDGVKAGDKSVLMVEGFTPMILTHFEPVEEGYEGKKIIAYKPKGNAPELDLPLLPEIVVEDDVEKLAESYYTQIRLAERTAFKFGYKSATKVYSEEDLKKMFAYAHQVGMNTLLQTQSPHLLEKQDEHKLRDGFIQSLKQPKWFVAEVEKKMVLNLGIDVRNPNTHVYVNELKTETVNNKTYLVGTYLN